MVEEVRSGDIDDDQERQSDGDGDEMDARMAWMDSATSDACHDSKRVGMKTLAEVESNQHKWRVGDHSRRSKYSCYIIIVA